jgi:hypothetical protein
MTREAYAYLTLPLREPEWPQESLTEAYPEHRLLGRGLIKAQPFTRGTPRGLFGSMGLMASHS